jgi:hypothetical protein
MKPKAVNWDLIEEPELYTFVQDLIDRYHLGKHSIQGINFVLMWRHNVKQDADGYILLADITKSSDKVRELRPHDIIIGINKHTWDMLEYPEKCAVIDTQLERIAISVDKEDNPKEDDRSRTIYRLRRLEVVDENTIIRRHGTTIQTVQEKVQDKLSIGNAEEGSYIAQQLSEDADDSDLIDSMSCKNNSGDEDENDD